MSASDTHNMAQAAGRSVGRGRRRRDAGFTLIELLVVLVILGLLAALAGPRVLNYLSGARADTAKLQIENLRTALDLYRLHTGNYPTTQQGLKALMTNPDRAPGWNGPYLDSRELPVDPWGTPYVYRSPGQREPYELVSLGADKAPGGQGDAADISSANR
jgi:general secretion pathway protein G